MRSTIILLLLTHFSFLHAQEITIEGEAIITQMNQDNSINELVVRDINGKLNTRSVHSLSSVLDTTRTLSSDLELAKFMCECGDNLPPFLIEQLKEAGYTNQDLIGAGIPIEKIMDVIPVIDGDGNEYEYVLVNGIKWMTSNLKTTTFNNKQNSISHIASQADWSNINNSNPIPAYCVYDNKPISSVTDGVLYNFFVLDPTIIGTLNICPVGWEIPTEQDFLDLVTAIDPGSDLNINNVGVYCRSEGNEFWDNSFYNGLDVIGLSMKGSGYRSSSPVPFGSFNFKNRASRFWTKDINSTGTFRIGIYIDYNRTSLISYGINKSYGASIRCIQK